MTPRSHGYLRISDYGLIGNGQTAALVGRDGSIDWCCLPALDSPSVFGALLDQRKGGSFRVAPCQLRGAEQRYLPGTNVLETRLQAETGLLSLTDYMPLHGSLTGRATAPSAPEIHRILCCESGELDVRLEWTPRFDYARAPTSVARGPGGFLARSAGEQIALAGAEWADIRGGEHGPVVEGSIRLRAGDRLALVTRYGPGRASADLDTTLEAFRSTMRAWRGWAHICDPAGSCVFSGRYHQQVVRSGLLLKLLAHRESGAIAAAPTTSLPEDIGGVRNWDYRFSWVRDSSLAAQALFALGHREEARRFLQWVEDVSWTAGDEGYDLQILYGLHGEHDLAEHELWHLEGYRGSRPVRIGNAAAEQRQLDVYGELVNAAYESVRMGARLTPRLWGFLQAVLNRACAEWREPDQGIWEVRSEPRHFTHSKLMVWVCLDRALRLAEAIRLDAPVGQWRQERSAVRRAILAEGFDPELGAFVRAFGSKSLDAANLLIPVMEFLPAEDPRVQGTIDCVLKRLMENRMVYRYDGDDGLSGGEGIFGLCTFWLVDALVLSGRVGEAREIFQEMAGRASHLGLYAEEIDPSSGEFLGNFPQAFSHVGFVNSALYIARAEGRSPLGPAPMGSVEHGGEAGYRTGAAV